LAAIACFRKQAKQIFLPNYIGSFWSRMDKPEFFLLVAGIAAVAGVMILGCRRVVGRPNFQE